eukprot:m.8941 g.8941  ORF g.8941 m.8941 type:complete len:175 (-) comp9321_c0_seq2:81-605(-)
MAEQTKDHHGHSSTCQCHKSQLGGQQLSEVQFDRSLPGAAANGDVRKLKAMIDNGTSINATDRDGYTALHYMARQGNLEVCQYLITRGALVNAQTRLGLATPLHRAAITGHLPVIRLLVEHGADVLQPDKDGQNAAHKAAMAKHDTSLHWLLQHYPEAKTAKDRRGRVPDECRV